MLEKVREISQALQESSESPRGGEFRVAVVNTVRSMRTGVPAG